MKRVRIYYPLRKTVLLKVASALSSSLASLEQKGILCSFILEVGRLNINAAHKEPLRELSKIQSEALQSINKQFKDKDTVLLHGVTSSGKTEIYIHLIEEQMKIGNKYYTCFRKLLLRPRLLSDWRDILAH